MKDDFGGLMELGSQRKFAVSGKVDLTSESWNVADKHVSLLGRLKEVEGVVVKNAIFKILSALN